MVTVRSAVVLVSIASAAVVQTATSAAGHTLASEHTVTVANNGMVRSNGRQLGHLAQLPPAPRSVHVDRPVVDGHRLIHVRISGKSERIAELLVTSDEPHRSLFAGMTGPQGVDGEWSLHLEINSQHVMLYQLRPGWSRCDGAPSYLFPELYDFAAQRFRPAQPTPARRQLPLLTATRRRPRGGGVRLRSGFRPLNSFHMVAASSQVGDQGNAANLVPPVEAEDGRRDTAWIAGIDGQSPGVFITARRPASPYPVRALRILPGDTHSRRAFSGANRLKTVLLVVSPHDSYRVRFARDPLHDRGRFDAPYWVVLPQPTLTNCISLIIESAYPGVSDRGRRSSANRTTIAELDILTDPDLRGGIDRLVRDLSADEPFRATAAAAALIRQGDRSVPALAAAEQAAKPNARERVIAVLAQIRSPTAAIELAAALPRLRRPARREAIQGLLRIGQPAVAPLVAQMQASHQRSIQLSRAVARALGQLGGSQAYRALITAAGAGPVALRATVVGALAQAARDQPLEPLVTAALDPNASEMRRADLVTAIGRAVAVAQAERVARRLASLWTQSSAFELRYRLIRTLGRLRSPLVLEVLEQAAALQNPVLRWQAIDQIGRIRGSAATARLLRALDDPDPRVRRTAVLRLIERGPVEKRTIDRLITLLETERWPLVARAAAAALGTRCTSQTSRALRRAIDRAPEIARQEALGGWARCAPASAARDLLALAADSARSAQVRTRALMLISHQAANRYASELMLLFRRLLAPSAGEAELQIASACAQALARSDTPSAVASLADVLAHDPRESIRAGTAQALGLGCSRGRVAALRRALQDSSPVVRSVVRASVRSCRETTAPSTETRDRSHRSGSPQS